LETAVDRYWLLTWRTYGTRLPGDDRGFVCPVTGPDGIQVIHNAPGTPIDADIPALREYARQIMKGPPVLLNREQAEAVLEQLMETARYRGWQLLAVAILADHVHVVVGVPGDPEPEVLLRDFKSYGSRRLNRAWPRPAGGTWWVESGSRRILRSESAVLDAVRYVMENQPNPLVVYRSTRPGERPA
jgi:REP element-mobilizing transposase RayT